MPCRVGTRVPLTAVADTVFSSSRTTTTATSKTTWQQQQTCSFSTTPCCERITRKREIFYEWVRSRTGQDFRNNMPGKYTSMVEGQPFPNNPLFRAEPIVNEFTKTLIHRRAMEQGQPIRAIAAEMGLDIRRVAAIVRLEQAQKEWIDAGKKVAIPYARAVHSMLQIWGYYPNDPKSNVAFEPVNDIHMHRETLRQVFVSVSESHQFTRQDAADVFGYGMLPVQKRSPQRGLIAMERKNIEAPLERKKHWEEFEAFERESEERLAARLANNLAKENEAMVRYKSKRFEFRIRKMNVDDVGKLGRSRRGQGWRYGAPLPDRKVGLSKMPTSVP